MTTLGLGIIRMMHTHQTFPPPHFWKIVVDVVSFGTFTNTAPAEYVADEMLFSNPYWT